MACPEGRPMLCQSGNPPDPGDPRNGVNYVLDNTDDR
jgi:hypothetical protein